MSVEEAGAARGGENVKVRYIHLFLLRFISCYCYFKCTFLSLVSMCQRKIFIFMLYILMNNKDLFDLIYIVPVHSFFLRIVLKSCVSKSDGIQCRQYHNTLKPYNAFLLLLFLLLLLFNKGNSEQTNYSKICVCCFVSYYWNQQHTQELIRARKTSHKHNNKDLSRLR